MIFMESNYSLQDVFLRNLKMSARTVSVSTLLSDRYLRRVNFDPYYQRNYVWETDKQSFFIESVILGTEIPPIVFFKSGLEIEVIDGRQRFETLKRFKENDITLSNKGLMELKALNGKTFSSGKNCLSEDVRQVFLNTNIRIFEFEVFGISNLYPGIEYKIKKEIFRRYNSGITPLRQSEVDNAKYNSDLITDCFKNQLEADKEAFNVLNTCFVPGDRNNGNIVEQISDITAFLRQMLVIDRLPITRFADGRKSFYIDILYDDFVTQLEDVDVEGVCRKLISQVKRVAQCYNGPLKTVCQCLLWGVIILEKDGKSFDLTAQKDAIKSSMSIRQRVIIIIVMWSRDTRILVIS